MKRGSSSGANRSDQSDSKADALQAQGVSPRDEARGEHGEPAHEALRASGERNARATIVLVSGDRDAREAVRQVLEPRFDVVTPADGDAALSLVRRARPDLLLCEATTPTLDAAGLLRTLRADEGTRDVPVVLLSAHPGEGARSEAIAAGADDYVVAPFSAGDLVSRVEACALLGRERRVRCERERELTAEVAARKEAESGRKRAEQALSEADRRKKEFLALLAHELRNPLAPLKNGLELMQLAGLTNPTQVRAHEMMQRQLSNLVRLVDDLLDVSRMTRGKFELRKERVDLKSVVENAVETVRPLMEGARHDMRVSLPSSDVFLMADPVRLAQVFANLLGNSAKYTPPGGRIRLSASVGPKGVEVRVEDNGIGIAAEGLPTIFEMFGQAHHESAGGTGGLGIGLALVRGLVEMHDGEVRAESPGPGGGAVFTVSLPVLAVEERVRDAEPPSAEPGARRPARQRVLVVDDNVDSASSMATLLDIVGHEVREAHDGQEAIELTRVFQPDVVLMDIGMPVMDGLEAARRIRKLPLAKQPTMVALTGWGQSADRERSKEAGFDHHLVKPVDLNVLKELLEPGTRAEARV
jgi:signal transduction histidine kinase